MKGNQLESGSYTSIFEIFVIDDAGGFNVDDTIIYHVYGDSHHTINTFNSNKINSQYTKSIIQFTTDGRAGVDDGVKFQIKYFGSQYNKNIKFLFYSRVVKGKQSISFDHTIFNVLDTQDNHMILYFENLNLNGNIIDGLGDPVHLDSATNKNYVDIKNAQQNIAIADKASKSYVDGEIAKVHIDTTPLLPRDGSRKMTGNLDMDRNHILNIENLNDHKVDDAYDDIVRDLKSVVNKEYLNENFLKKDKDGDYFDLKQGVIKNSAPYDDGSYDTLVSKAFVNNEISKIPKPDTDVLKLDGSKVMTGNLNMGDRSIIGIRSYNVDDAALTVGGAKATYLQLSGNRSMQGILNMGGHAITNIKPFVEDDSKDQKNEVINFNYFPTQRGELKRLINETAYEALNRKDPDPMQDDINMANHSIINLKDPQPSDNSHAASVNFVNNTINNNNFIMVATINDKIKESETHSIELIGRENVFKKVMDDDEFKEDDSAIHDKKVVNKDFHSINKKTYEFKIDYDSSDGIYSTRLEISLIYLPIGYYTMVYEMYIDDGLTVDQIDAIGDSIHVEKINSKIDGTNTRSIIQLHKSIKYPDSDDLNIDIKLKGKNDPQTTIHVVVYGVKGYVNDVSVNLWDRYYYYDNDTEEIKCDASINMNSKEISALNLLSTLNLDVLNKLDMNNNNIINLKDGVDDGDAINKAQFDKHIKYYYFTNDLKHANGSQIKFPANVDKYPFLTKTVVHTRLVILLSGYYHLIYTDLYKGGGKFIINHDRFDGVHKPPPPFTLELIKQSDWTPITINAIMKIDWRKVLRRAEIVFEIDFGGDVMFKGAGHSTFYIKYLHP